MYMEEQENGIKNMVRLCRKFKATIAETISELIESYGLSEDTASQKVEQYWNAQ